MPTITFNTGSASVSVTGKTVYGTKYNDKRYAQSSLETAEGTIVANDNNGINVIVGVIVIKDIDYTEGEALRTWLHDEAIFAMNSFSITSDNSESDLGEGKDVALTGVNFDGNSDKGVFKHRAPDRYDIKFPYTVVRT